MAKLKASETEFALSVPSHCDMCHRTILEYGSAFVDGRTYSGQWANMCVACHKSYGCGLGTGKGQRYQLQAGGKWAKMVPVTEAKRSTKQPSLATLERWSNDGVAKATDGCRVEPDGTCEHGKPSWLIQLGYV